MFTIQIPLPRESYLYSRRAPNAGSDSLLEAFPSSITVGLGIVGKDGRGVRIMQVGTQELGWDFAANLLQANRVSRNYSILDCRPHYTIFISANLRMAGTIVSYQHGPTKANL